MRIILKRIFIIFDHCITKEITVGLKKLIPARIKALIKYNAGAISDLANGTKRKFATRHHNGVDQSEWIHQLIIEQPIFVTSLSVNKILNINIAKERIEQIEIHSGQILSFWHVIGEPIRKNGYTLGRNLIEGRLQEDYGGGLCQLAGIIYHLAITSGLTIIERHNHSVDLYEDDERFTPLGADASVVYGHKDLRIENNLAFPIRFEFDVKEDKLIARLLGKEKFESIDLTFERSNLANGQTKVRTIMKKINSKNVVLTEGIYTKVDKSPPDIINKKLSRAQ